MKSTTNYLEKVYTYIYQAKNLGFQKLDNGTELIGRAPHIAPQAWLHKIFHPLNMHQIQILETEMDFTIPLVLKEFFLSNNGLSIFSSSISFYGLRTSYERNGDAVWQPFDIILPNTYGRSDDSNMDELCFGGYGFDGSRLYINTITLKVYRRMPESSVILNTWNSFEEMVLTETERLYKLFDKEGKNKYSIGSTVPISQV